MHVELYKVIGGPIDGSTAECQGNLQFGSVYRHRRKGQRKIEHLYKLQLMKHPKGGDCVRLVYQGVSRANK